MPSTGCNERRRTPLRDVDVLMVAADAREYSGLLRHASAISRAGAGAEWSRWVTVGGYRALLVANGAGPKLAAEAARRALDLARVRSVVSTGFCGALDPDLGIGDVVVGTEVIWGNQRVPAAQPPCGAVYRTGAVISIDRIACSAGEKSRLRMTGASVVEMEAAGVAATVREWRLPFFCIRSVSDLATESFVLDLNASRLPDGRISTSRIIRSAFWNPRKAVPELYRLQRQCSAAARVLGDFLADCRF